MFEPVKAAFNKQSDIFDKYEESNEVLKWMRTVIRQHLLRHLNPGSRILELNAGTGLDTVFLSKQGFNVHATDISDGMLSKLEIKVNKAGLNDKVSFEVLSFTELDQLKIKNSDYIFSNFGGLNCIEDLSMVTKHLKRVLNLGGKITFVIMPPVSPWEIMLAVKGKFKPAFRRLHKGGALANIEGIKFNTYYHSLRTLKHALGTEFKLIEIQGLASLSPPPYVKDFPLRHPVLYKILCRADEIFSHTFPFDRCADHYIATFELKREQPKEI